MIKVQKKDFDIEKEIQVLKNKYSNVGAVNVFVGYVRDLNNNRDVKYLELEVYKEQRAAEYPSYAEQFDKIFREGVDAWKADIQAIKDKYPKQTMDSDELERRKQQALTDLETES